MRQRDMNRLRARLARLLRADPRRLRRISQLTAIREDFLLRFAAGEEGATDRLVADRLNEVILLQIDSKGGGNKRKE